MDMTIFLRRLWHISKRGFLLAALIASLPLLLPSLSIATFIGFTLLFHLCCAALLLAFLRGLFSPSSARRSGGGGGRKSPPPPIEVSAFLRVPPSCSIGFVEGFALGLSQLQRFEESSVHQVVDQLSRPRSAVGLGSPNSWPSLDFSPVGLNRETNVGAEDPPSRGDDKSFSSISGGEHYAEPSTSETGLDDCCCSVVKEGIGSPGSVADQDRTPSSWRRNRDGEVPTIGETEAKECMKVVEFCLAQAAGFGLDEDDEDDNNFDSEQVEDADDFVGDLSFRGRSQILLEQSQVLEKLAEDQRSCSAVEKLWADQRQGRLSDDDSPRPSSSLTCISGSSSTPGTSSLWSSNDKLSGSSSTPTSSASSVNNKYRTPPADTLGYGRKLFGPAAMSLPAKTPRRRPTYLDDSSSSSSSSSNNNNDFFCDTDPSLSRFAQLLRFWRAKEREMDSISRGRRKDLFGRLNNQ